HLAIRCDAPGPNGVVVVIGIVATHSEKLGQCRLDVTGLICCATLNHGRLAVPSPGKPEAGQGPRQHRLLQPRLLPALAVIDRDVDPLDLAMSAPGDTADLVKAWRAQSLATRGSRD